VTFLQSIFRKLSPARPPAAPRLHLAVFGKHPGWNDHIDDLGLETDLLVNVKRTLYVQGIGGNIDAGAWDRLEEGQRVPAFHHLFVSHSAGDLIVGRLWSSSDGKGRTRYPMVAAAHCAGMPLSWIVSNVVPRLEQIESACAATRDPAAVRSILDLQRQSLRSLMPAAVPGRAESVAAGDGNAVSSIAAHPDMGDGGRGFLLVLYQIEREWSAFRPGRGGAPGPRHLRVPSCADSPVAAMVRWLGFLLSQLDGSAPLMVIVPLDASWADLIGGEPTASQLFCVRATPAKVPLTTQIPYTLDADFISRAMRTIAAAG
jgi:hypothetical protein